MADDLPAFVLDASALAKAVLDEHDREGFRSWYRAAAVRGSPFHAPELLGYELAYVLADHLGSKEAANFGTAVDAVVGGIRFHRSFRSIAPFLADASAYDANYLAVAVSTGSALVTYDRDLQRAARRHGVPVVAPQ